MHSGIFEWHACVQGTCWLPGGSGLVKHGGVKRYQCFCLKGTAWNAQHGRKNNFLSDSLQMLAGLQGAQNKYVNTHMRHMPGHTLPCCLQAEAKILGASEVWGATQEMHEDTNALRMFF